MIYLVRHGQTEFNRDGRYQGACDSPLTALGIEQGRAVGATLAALIDAPERWKVVASPLGRALRTAELIRDSLGLAEPIQIDPRLREVSLGRWDGLTDEEIEDISPGACDGADRFEWFFRAPDGESYEQTAARLDEWLRQSQDRDIIAVAHGLSGRILRGRYLGLPKHETLRLDAPQDALFRLADGRVEHLACSPVT